MNKTFFKVFGYALMVSTGLALVLIALGTPGQQIVESFVGAILFGYGVYRLMTTDIKGD